MAGFPLANDGAGAGGVARKRSPSAGDAAEVEAAGRVLGQGGVEGIAEGWIPVAIEGEEAAQDVPGRLRGVDAVGVGDRQAGPVKLADARTS